MISSNKNLLNFYRNLWQTVGVIIISSVLFVIYVRAEKEIDRANERHHNSYLLADELRQSSDDLTRMVRTYILTGNPIYKQHYQEILDIRNGTKPRPLNYNNIYWDLVLSDDKRPHPSGSQAIALFSLMQNAGFTKQEFTKLSISLKNSNKLTEIEYSAMKLAESAHLMTDANRHIAYDMLNDETYNHAKYEIMKPIGEFNSLVEKRTLEDVLHYEKIALLMRIIFIFFALVLIVMLWRIYKSLQVVLGASLDKLYVTINAMGSGNFSSPTAIPLDKKDTVLDWLYETQQQLSELEASRQKSEKEAKHLTQLYIALSRCNQAIVHSTNENELFEIICEDAVKFGDMLMTWVGIYDKKSQELKAVSYAGEGTEYLRNLHISADANNPTACGPSATAFHEDKPYWCQDFQNDPATVLWHQQGEQFGWKSSAALPLHRNGVVIGTFNLYAGEVNAFDEMSQKLLIEMTSDMDFALKNFDREAANKKAEVSLSIQAQAMEQSSNIIIITDFKGNISYVNGAFVKTTGYTAEEAIGKNPRFLKSGKTSPNAHDEMWLSITKGSSWQGEFINKRKDGTEYIYFISVSPVMDINGRITHYIAIEEDITEQKQTMEKIHYLANYDLLTGLPNRIQLNDRFHYILNLAKRNKREFSVMFIDLDHFKEINDTLGHSVGDALLVEIAKRFMSILREGDTVARLGGDEFILLFPDTDAKASSQIAQKLLGITAKSFLINEYEIIATASIGIALYPSDGLDVETLSKNADAAMYRTKQDGRNSYCFFTQEMQKLSTRTLELSNALHHALERNELYLVYQPQISLKNGNIIGAEALLRWESPLFGTVSPAEFIPIAEENGLIIPIGEWVLRTAIAQTKAWLNDALPIVIAINLSAIQFRQPNLSKTIAAILEENDLAPEYIEIELTEGMAMHNPQMAISIMDNLYKHGIRMSIDDFGTGYSSLSYLKKFKVYKLKIDQSFVRDISVDDDDKAIVSAIIQMAHSLGLETIAEGVETIEQLEYLKEQGCDEIQGYFYSKPLLPEQFKIFSEQHKK